MHLRAEHSPSFSECSSLSVDSQCFEFKLKLQQQREVLSEQFFHVFVSFNQGQIQQIPITLKICMFLPLGRELAGRFALIVTPASESEFEFFGQQVCSFTVAFSEGLVREIPAGTHYQSALWTVVPLCLQKCLRTDERCVFCSQNN